MIIIVGCQSRRGGTVVRAVASQQEGCGFDSWARLHVLSISAWVPSRFSSLPQSKNMQVGELGSKLSAGLHESVKRMLVCLYVALR